MIRRTDRDTTSTIIPSWVTLDELCFRTGLSRSGAYLALQRKQLTARKLGRKILVDLPAALAWIESQPEPTFRQPA